MSTFEAARGPFVPAASLGRCNVEVGRHATLRGCLLACLLLGPAVLHGQGGLPRELQTPPEAPSARPLGAPASFGTAARDAVEVEGGSVLRHAPTPAAGVAFEFPEGRVEEAVLLDRRETASGVWLRLRFGGIYGWYQESVARIDQAAALDENPARLERRARLRRVAEAKFEREPITLIWTLATAQREQDVAVRLFVDLDRRTRKRLEELAACVPNLYATRFGPVAPSRALPVDIFVFSEEEEYDAFADTELATSIQESGGLELDGLVFVNGETTLLSLLATVAHEMAHVLNRFAFPEDYLPIWLEEGIAEDIAHSVEAAVVTGRSPCERPGGWARTRVRESTEFVDGKETQRTDLQRTGRGRTLLCYAGRGAEDPDVRDLTALEFGASYRREVLYLEAALLLRDLLEQAASAADARSLIADWRREADAREMDVVVDQMLNDLPWRPTERSWLPCR